MEKVRMVCDACGSELIIMPVYVPDDEDGVEVCPMCASDEVLLDEEQE